MGCFQCQSGKIIPRGPHCNGEDDCDDRSDDGEEHGCRNKEKVYTMEITIIVVIAIVILVVAIVFARCKRMCCLQGVFGIGDMQSSESKKSKKNLKLTMWTIVVK